MPSLNRKPNCVAAQNKMNFRGPNHLWDMANETFAHGGRDWAGVTLAAPAAGARFGHRDDTNGINVKSAGVYRMVRDLKEDGRHALRRWPT